MHDIQSLPDERGIAIEQAGVCDLRYPIVILDRSRAKQETIAHLTMSVGLRQDSRGTHMSRFLEVLHEHRGELTMHTLPGILQAVRRRLEADSALLEARFSYFLERSAPASGAKGLMDYECLFRGSLDGHRQDFVLGVTVPVTSLCPCSKAISDYGAHNQRGLLEIEVRTEGAERGEPAFVWIEELIEVAESSGSAPVYPLLKRSDERFVTMQAYDNPVFVEDMVRNVAVRLREDPRIQWFSVKAVNHESIHNHSAFARTSWARAN